jgi:S1/P1 Nuclease
VHYPADCDNNPGEGCIISAIANQTSLFLDLNSPAIVRQEALKFIVHFIGDIHQPLHTENLDRGGNEIPVCWRKACAHTNLHGVWDTNIPMTIAGVHGSPTADEERANAARWADELTGGSEENVEEILEAECADVLNPDSCTLEWAREVNYFNCKYVLQPSPDALAHQDLSTTYYDGAKPIVEYLIGRAGVRLAAYLEALVKHTMYLGSEIGQEVLDKGDLR